MKSTPVLLLSLLLLLVFTFSDVSAKPKKKRLIEIADSTFFAENFPAALILYDEILEDYHSTHYVQYHRYVAYHLSKGRGSDVEQIYEYEKNEGHVDKFYNYWLGRIHFNRYEFDLAEEHFRAFLAIKSYKSKEIKAEAQRYIRKIDRAKIFHRKVDDYIIINVDHVNSEYADLSPAFFAGHNELLFLSSRPVDGEYQKDTYKIFHSLKNDDDWGTPTDIPRFGVFSKKNAKIEVVNQDGRLFMFLNGKKGGLYFSEQNSYNWKMPQKFDAKIDEKTIDAHFFINDAEDAIYFSANQTGNRLDLLESHFDKESQTWSDPQPLKGEINSRYDDDSPFLSHDGKYMYFSSNRRGTLGGYDIYRSSYNSENQTWSAAENLGFPINTIDDEINFQLNVDNISGYFSSNRLHSKGDFDIYYFHEAKKIIASGIITEKNSGKPIPNVEVEFHPIKYRDEFFPVTTDSEGKYRVEIFENEEFLIQLSLFKQALSSARVKSIPKELHRSLVTNFSIDISHVKFKKTNFKDLYQGTEDVEEEYDKIEMLGSKFRAGKKAILKNVYFDSHSFQMKKSASPVVDQVYKLLSTTSDLKIEVSGHTDNIGNKTANQTLSLKRAQSVKNALIAKGIKGNRIITKGYGDSKPLASNDDEESGRELNRRIEVRLID